MWTDLIDNIKNLEYDVLSFNVGSDSISPNEYAKHEKDKEDLQRLKWLYISSVMFNPYYYDDQPTI